MNFTFFFSIVPARLFDVIYMVCIAFLLDNTDLKLENQ